MSSVKNINNIFIILLLSGSAIFAGCGIFDGREETGTPVARVYNQYLYDSELRKNIPAGLKDTDSANAASKYIKSWIERQLLVHNAEQNLGDKKETIQKRLEEYKKDLLIYTYQSRLVSQKLDTVVNETEITEYYKDNKENFRLKDDIVRLIYVKLDAEAPNINQVRTYMNNWNAENLINLEEYCIQFASNSYLEPNNWLYVDDLLKEVPLRVESRRNLVKNRRLIELEEDGYIYLLKIIDGLEKGEMSPLTFERENIKNMILNKRKVKFLNELKEDFYQSAEQQNNFEIYL